VVTDGYEPRCAIQATRGYKGWYRDFNFGNKNLTVLNNYFSLNVPCYLHLENVSILTHDLTDYWYRSFQVNLSYTGKYEFYIPNYYNNLSRWSTTIKYDIRIANGTLDQKHFTYSIYKDYDYYKNINTTEIYDLIVYNLTNALIFNTNGSIYGSSNIADNDGNINITLTPNNASYVLDNFNLTEGVIRAHSPITFPSTDSNSKTITSTLTDSIIVNITFEVDNCDEVSSVSLNGNPISYNCNSPLTITGTINPGSNSLTLNEYTSGSGSICKSLSLGLNEIGSKIPIILGIIGVLLLITFLTLLFSSLQGTQFDFGLGKSNVDFDFDFDKAKIWIFGIGGLIMLSIIILIIVSVVCSIQV